MLKADYHFDLPSELIASFPKADRVQAKLLCAEKNSTKFSHKIFSQVIDFIEPNDLLIVNESKVMRASLLGKKETGGRVEILIERIISARRAIAHVYSNKSLKVGTRIYLDTGTSVELIYRNSDNTYLVEISSNTCMLDAIENFGRIPLPPYMQREAVAKDTSDFQTVYAKVQGSIASPSAGLHFDEVLLRQIEAKGIKIEKILLHIGAGTFKPVTSDSLTDHVMHSEYFEVTQEVCDAIKETKKNNGRVIAVGTTTVRALEAAASLSENELITPYAGDTKLFIYPGFEFKVIDSLITNFHLPYSTLLMLVSAIIGRQRLLTLYRQAIDLRYRFYTYGDAMFIY